MKKTSLYIVVMICAAILLSCATITTPVSATSNKMGSKVGVATGKIYLAFFGGDTKSGIQEAAKNGGITRISSVDFSYSSKILGLVRIYSCTVTGE